MAKILSVLAILTFLIYLPSLKNGFIHYDDPEILLNNEAVNQHDIKKILTNIVATDYIPLTLLTFTAEHYFFGHNPFYYHLDNVFFHIFNSLLVFFLIFSLTSGNSFISIFVSVLFAFHPCHVESVAWITERKDVLYSFFFLLAAISYIHFVRKKQNLFIFLAFFLFILSCLSKTSAVAFSLIICTLDYYLGRSATKAVIIEKIPFFAISAVISFIRVTRVEDSNYIIKESHNPPWQFLLNAFDSIVFYTTKLLVPKKLSVIYETGAVWIDKFEYGLFGIFLLLLYWFVRKKKVFRKDVIFGILFFFFMLGPILQFIPFGNKIAFADRYTYVPSIGLFYIIGIMVWNAWISPNAPKGTLFILMGLIFGIFCQEIFIRASVFKNDETLWDDVVSKYPKSSIGTNNLGLVQFEKGNLERAKELLIKALELDPQHLSSYLNLATLYFKTAQPEKGFEKYEQVLKVAPANPELHLRVAQGYAAHGKNEIALEQFRKTIELDPTNVSAHEGMVRLLYKIGKPIKAQ